MKVQNVETLDLNDSGVLEIFIKSGVVQFKIDYIEDYGTDTSNIYRLQFNGCRYVSSTINLNVTWPDSILCAAEIIDGEWRNIKLEMLTSASVFNISCRSVSLLPVESQDE